MRYRLFNSANEQSRDTPSVVRASFKFIIFVPVGRSSWFDFALCVYMKIKSNHLLAFTRSTALIFEHISIITLLFLCACHFSSICTNGVYQHEHKVLQMINGAVVVVVILQEFVGVCEHVRHVVVVQQLFAL